MITLKKCKEISKDVKRHNRAGALITLISIGVSLVGLTMVLNFPIAGLLMTISGLVGILTGIMK